MLRKISIVIILTFIFQCSIGQVSAIEIVNENTIIYNTENFLKIVVENTECQSIFIKSDAEIKRKEDCYWTLKPKKYNPFPGLEVNIFKVYNLDTLFLEKKSLR